MLVLVGGGGVTAVVQAPVFGSGVEPAGQHWMAGNAVVPLGHHAWPWHGPSFGPGVCPAGQPSFDPLHAAMPLIWTVVCPIWHANLCGDLLKHPPWTNF